MTEKVTSGEPKSATLPRTNNCISLNCYFASSLRSVLVVPQCKLMFFVDFCRWRHCAGTGQLVQPATVLQDESNASTFRRQEKRVSQQ